MKYNVSIEKVKNGYIVISDNPSQIGLETGVFLTFGDVVEFQAHYFNEVAIGEHYVQIISGAKPKERSEYEMVFRQDC